MATSQGIASVFFFSFFSFCATNFQQTQANESFPCSVGFSSKNMKWPPALTEQIGNLANKGSDIHPPTVKHTNQGVRENEILTLALLRNGFSLFTLRRAPNLEVHSELHIVSLLK